MWDTLVNLRFYGPAAGAAGAVASCNCFTPPQQRTARPVSAVTPLIAQVHSSHWTERTGWAGQLHLQRALKRWGSSAGRPGRFGAKGGEAGGGGERMGRPVGWILLLCSWPAAAGAGWCTERRDDESWADSYGDDCTAYKAGTNASSSPYGYCCPETWPDCGSEEDDGGACCDAADYATEGVSAREACCQSCGVVDVCDPYLTTVTSSWQSLQFNPKVGPASGRGGALYTAAAGSVCSKVIQAPASKHIVFRFIGNVTRSDVEIVDVAAAAPFDAAAAQLAGGQNSTWRRLWPSARASSASTGFQLLVRQNTSSPAPWTLEWAFENGTCFDGVQNLGETSVDCGGMCGSCQPESEQESRCSDDVAISPHSVDAVGRACPYECDLLEDMFVSNMSALRGSDMSTLAGSNCNHAVADFPQYIDTEVLQILVVAETGVAGASPHPAQLELLVSTPPWNESNLAGISANILLQGNPTMPALNARIKLQQGGNLLSRYLHWTEGASADADSSIDAACYVACRISIFRCSFEGLSAAEGGAIRFDDQGGGAVLQAEQTVFRGCHARSGGAIFMNGNLGNHSEMILVEVTFIRCFAVQTAECPEGPGQCTDLHNSGNGGAVYADAGSLEINEGSRIAIQACVFTQNSISRDRPPPAGLQGDSFVTGGSAVRIFYLRPDGWYINATMFEPYDSVRDRHVSPSVCQLLTC